MGTGAFGWLAFGWYSVQVEEGVQPPELIGIGGSAALSPDPGGRYTGLRVGGALSVAKPGGTIRLKP